jgi:hypothetical protein
VDGWVSLELSPLLAYDTAKSIAEACDRTWMSWGTRRRMGHFPFASGVRFATMAGCGGAKPDNRAQEARDVKQRAQLQLLRHLRRELMRLILGLSVARGRRRERSRLRGMVRPPPRWRGAAAVYVGDAAIAGQRASTRVHCNWCCPEGVVGDGVADIRSRSP